MKTVLSDSQQSLEQWVSQATGISTLGVKIQLRGNDLHILCEGSECPRRWRTLSDLLQALQQTDLDVLTSSEQSSIYQVFVYGRKKGDFEPQWCHRVYLNQLEQHLEQVKDALLEDVPESSFPAGALIISNESLARSGDRASIARYLSETLSSLGVAVQVKVKFQPTTEGKNSDRLWIYCQSSYTPDPSLIAEPVAQKLRSLKLAGYQDAVIASQVKGETTPDWVLRIDLTPAEAMLKEWARWGDLQAITRLLNESTKELKVSVEATLKESTLHIFCTPVFPLAVQAPDKTQCLAAIVPQLEAIAPQGILRATVYGKTAEDHPAWIDWLSLPADEHPALSTPALELASSGDREAIIFLLERLLNPELDLRLKTGGVRVLLLFKEDLLHIMCDAPVCPGRKQVAQKVTQFVSSLKISGIAGVRVYGRRAGNKEPIWQYGVDFKQRQRLIPEATPEFAATSAYVSELLPTDTTEPDPSPNLTKSEVHLVTQAARDWGVLSKQFLLETQLFKETDSSPQQTAHSHGLRVALVWGALGLLLTIQTDWVLGQIIARTMPTQLVLVPRNKSSTKEASFTSQTNQTQNTAFASTSGQKSFVRSYAFNASEFTQTEPPNHKATSTAILLAARSRLPSFNTRQLDEQLALYRQRLAKTGSPPQVLIIGSSRALRGVDPAALSQGLAAAGYPKIDVFNFGINGATAQVVDFIIRYVLKPSELPKLILWADGTRAFNSGREDMTFKAIAASPGYKQVLAKPVSHDSPKSVLKTTTPTTKSQTKADQNTNSYQVINQWLNKALATVSPTYQQRDQIKNLLNQQLKSLPIIGNSTTAVSTQANSTPSEEESLQAIDFDGFLPLSVRFQPTKYYQKHPKVSGNFDNDYKFFGLQGEQDAALQTLLEFVQAHKISLVFVNMPLTADYLDPVRTKYEQEFQQYMLRLSDRPNFIYRDLNQLWPQANRYFSDPSHLNRYGAYEVSKKLANDPMIPWFSK